MKKLLSVALIAFIYLFSGCGLKEIVGPNAVLENHTNSDSYQPVTSGSKWVYNVAALGVVDVKTTVMKGATQVIDGRTFNVAVNTQKSDGSTSNSYYYHTGTVYTYREDPSSPDDIIEMQYLDDSAIIGSTFISKSNSSGTSGGLAVRWVGTILDKNSTRAVGSLTFKNVIHTKTELQYDHNDGKGFVPDGTVYEFYIAKGIGVVEERILINSATLAIETVTAYDIK